MRYADHLRPGTVCHPHDIAYMNYCVKADAVAYRDKVDALKTIEREMKTQEISCFKYNHSPGVLTQAGVTSFQSKLVLSEDGSHLLI